MPSLRAYLAQETRLVQEPGLGFMYSNVGFNVLELLIEEVTGRDFADYMADEVLMPLGMHTAHFSWNEALRPSMPTGYDLQNTPVPPYVYPANASGGLFAGVEDIARFVSAGMTGSYVADRSVKMGRITYATTALWALISVVVLVSLGLVYRLVRGLRSGDRRWALLSRKSRTGRLLQAALGLGGMAALAWSAAQPYLLVSSIFPSMAGWAGVSLFMLAVLMVLSALFPRIEDGRP